VRSTIQTVGKTNTIAQVKVTTQGTSYGVTQSDASRAAAPPVVPPLRSAATDMKTFVIGMTFVVGFIVPVALFCAGLGFFASMGLALVILVGGCTIGAVQGDAATAAEIAAHKTKYSEAYEAVEQWKHTFACGSCGHRFVPAGMAQESSAETQPA
jgi:hypothetical protein